jgi:ATP synthase protein I
MVYNFAALPGANRTNAMLRRLSKPVRVVTGWQLAATAAITLAAGTLAGWHGAVSAVAGGLISICAGLVAAVIAARNGAKSAGGVLVGALAAEAVKIVLAVILLLVVIAVYDGAVIVALIGSFMTAMLIFSMAFFVREY